MTRLPTFLIAAAIILVPVAFLVALRLNSDDGLSGIKIDASPIVAPITARSIDDRTGVEVALTWGDSASLIAPAWPGTVTAVNASPGDLVASGTAVLSVAGKRDVAYAGKRPFHRSLSSDDTGPDVGLLHQLLLDLGHMDALPARAGASSGAAWGQKC